jgi:small conductance mechanosensitive channel
METLGSGLRVYFDEALVAFVGALLARTALALVVLLAVLLLARIALSAARRAIRQTSVHANARLLVDRLIQFGFLSLAAIWVLSILGVELTALIAVFGAAALAVSLAMQDVLKNLVAGLYILLERPFTIGEQIDFRTFSGTVETIELRTTALRTASGQRVIIPNAMLFADTLVNRSTYGRQLCRLRIILPKEEATRERPQEVHTAAVAALGTAPVDSAILIEAITSEKLTLRLEFWSAEARKASQEAAWAIRERVPAADVTILE